MKLLTLPDVGPALGVALIGAGFVLAILFVVVFAIKHR